MISVGEERTKGNTQSMEAAELLERAPVRFVGNIEGKDILHNHADVVVADGFVGNVILKTAEGSATYIRDVLRESFERRDRSGSWAVCSAAASSRGSACGWTTPRYGGAPLLGVRGNCVVAHGRSDKIAIRNAIRQAAAVAAADLVGSIGAVLAA